MISKEEARDKIVEMYFNETKYYGKDFVSFIEYIYYDFEQQLKEAQATIEALEKCNEELKQDCRKCMYALHSKQDEIEALEYNFEAQEIMIVAMSKRIEELEALQVHKSCDGCKHQFMEEGDGLYHVYCGNCLRIHVDEYEPKDRQ